MKRVLGDIRIRFEPVVKTAKIPQTERLIRLSFRAFVAHARGNIEEKAVFQSNRLTIHKPEIDAHKKKIRQKKDYKVAKCDMILCRKCRHRGLRILHRLTRPQHPML
ncbi:hypothetical protein OUZ56_031663 [Daphnia magna]|uniref:Uncharacterized protein n=1 Tax=Daphnia magna TaxID=35525 RepID=A0ABQ9ZUV1_9CRUS|nr:hypothetical protein OUZ56_031663 [Daphnia magna]